MMSTHVWISKRRSTVLISALLVCLLAGVGSLHAQQPAKHPLLKKMVGTWASTGELHISEDGSSVALSEQWTGVADAEGNLVVEGTRKLNEDEQTFRWVYFFNASTELYEATYTDSNSEEEKTWQISINEADSVIEMQAPLGGGTTLSSRTKISNDRLVAQIKIVDQSGTEAASGTITHVREGTKQADD